MIFPNCTGGGAELLGLDAGRGDGLGLVAEGVGATEEFVEDGRDHPGPVTVEGWGPAVNLAVTRRECDGAV